MRAWLIRLGEAMIGIGLLTVTSRRWSAPLLASALGMGLFVGVAFGPAASRLDALGSQVLALNSGEALTAETTPTGSETTAGGSTGGGATAGGDASAPAPYSPAPYPTALAPTTPTPTYPSDPGAGRRNAADPGQDPDPKPSTMSGTVVNVNPAANSYALSVRGELYGVHAQKLPEPGEKLETPVRDLANGTYAEDGEREVSGTASNVALNGFVSFVDANQKSAPAYTLSMRGVSVLINLPEGQDSAVLPKVGAFVSAEVELRDLAAESVARHRAAEVARATTAAAEPVAPLAGCVRDDPGKSVEPATQLIQSEFDPSGDVYSYFDLAGTVQAICPESGELLISADGIRQGGADLALAVPKDIDLDLLEVDEPVLATAEVADDGALSLAGIASDAGIEGADDTEQLQGDFDSGG